MQEKGFSLVELMATVGIIAMLTSMATTGYRTYVIRARQTEAQLNVRFIETLITTHHATVADTSSSGSAPLDDPYWDLTGHPSCNIDNSLGFRIPNCKAARYGYAADLTNSTAYAFEKIAPRRSIFTGCSSTTGTDLWIKSANGELRNVSGYFGSMLYPWSMIDTVPPFHKCL